MKIKNEIKMNQVYYSILREKSLYIYHKDIVIII